jgi:DNA-binding PadR family transcriptional regulator
MLDLAVLGLLRREPRHGYDLKLQLAQLGFARVSFGALYPALRRLEKRGWIEALRPAARRKAYRLTEVGRSAHDALLNDEDDEPEGDRRFAMRLAFFEFIAPERRLGILRRRRSQLVARLGDATQALRNAGAIETDPYTLALVRHNVETIESDIAWLDELIAMARTDTRDRRNPT